MKKEFNGWNFDHPVDRKRMKYLVVTAGNLDLNNAYGFVTKKALQKYLSDESFRDTQAVFKIEDVTDDFDV